MSEILTISRAQAPHLPESGCWRVDDLIFLQPPLWQVRQLVERDDRYLQPIPYLMLRNPEGHIWCYQRIGGDARLDGRCSCGVGGHIDAQDAQPPQESSTPLNIEATLRHALLRELAEELAASEADLRDLRLQGLIYEGLSDVGRVHLGLLFTAQWLPAQAPQPVAGEALAGLGFRAAKEIANNPEFELWSRLAARYLL